MQHHRVDARHLPQRRDLLGHGRRRAVQQDVLVQRVVVAGARADVLRHRAEIARGVAAGEVREVLHDAFFALALGLGVGFGDIDPARHVDVAARAVGSPLRRRLFERVAIDLGLARQLGERRPARHHGAEAVAAGDAERALGRGGEEDRRVRLLDRMREQLVGAVDLGGEIPALVVDALVVQELHQHRQRFFLDVAAVLEVDAERVELILAVARAEPQHEAPAGQDVDEGGVLRDPQRIGERQGHDGSADLDALGQRREITGVDEHVRHDAVFIREVVLGDPGVVVAELVGPHDLLGDARMDVAVRVGLGRRVGMGREENSEFHLRFAP